MAMPASGNIAILDNTLQTCSSISCAVCGNNTPPKCLTALASAAGKAACMTAFYGYSSVSYTPIYFSNICEYATTDLNCVCGVAGSNCVGTVYCYWLDKMAGKTSAAVCIYCNGTAIRSCYIGGTGSCSVSGAFAVFTHDGNDCVRVCTRALDVLGDSYAYSCVALCSLTQCVGCFCIGAPAGAESYAGMAI